MTQAVETTFEDGGPDMVLYQSDDGTVTVTRFMPDTGEVILVAARSMQFVFRVLANELYTDLWWEVRV